MDRESRYSKYFLEPCDLRDRESSLSPDICLPPCGAGSAEPSVCFPLSFSLPPLAECPTPIGMLTSNTSFCLTYFIQTAINLFCNVLSHPLHPETNEDMNLMGLISDLIAAKKRARDPVCYVGKITFAQEIILELKRLARCAVDRATAARQASMTRNYAYYYSSTFL